MLSLNKNVIALERSAVAAAGDDGEVQVHLKGKENRFESSDGYNCL